MPSGIRKNQYSTDGILVRSILGGIIGDIAGSTREGYGSNTPYPTKILTANSYFTDDSALTIAVADWLNNKDSATLKDCLQKWSHLYPFVGFGGLFKAFMENGEAQESNGNGGAMRVAPIAVTASSLEEALSMAEEQCLVTHTTDIAITAAKAIAAAVFLAKEGIRNGKSDTVIKNEIKTYVEKNFGYDLNMSLEDIQRRSENLARQREEFRRTGVATEGYMNMSNAALSCPMAIMAFLMGNNFEESLRYSMAMLGDSDSIACMAGSISAQVYGIPQQLVEDALVYLPIEMVDVLNVFEDNCFVSKGITPPEIGKWRPNGEVIVYGAGTDENEKGYTETVYSRNNKYPKKGYGIPTIGKALDEIGNSITEFVSYAKSNPELRFHVRPVGYNKAGYTIEQIAPLFKEAAAVRNILLPKEIVEIL